MDKPDLIDAYLKKVAQIFDVEVKKGERRVRDADFWGMPVNTIIKPGMKPRGKTPSARRSSTSSGSDSAPSTETTPSGKPAPKKRVRVDKMKDGDGEGTKIDTSVRKAEDFSVEAAAEELGKINPEGSKKGSGTMEDPIDCGDDIEMARKLLAEGKHIRLNTEMQVSVLIDKIAEDEAFKKARGEKVPDYDLCRITVPKTSLFCSENKGIDRDLMPQFSGQPVEGSYAETKYDEAKGESNVTDEFAELLETMGIGVEERDVPVVDLKATQTQLVGTKVAGMRQAMREGKIKDKPIYVTRDGYIVDGHHRWAAKMGLDLEDGVLGDTEMPVYVIDADIGYIIDLSNGFTQMAGIKPKGTGAAADGVKRLSIENGCCPQ